MRISWGWEPHWLDELASMFPMALWAGQCKSIKTVGVGDRCAVSGRKLCNLEDRMMREIADRESMKQMKSVEVEGGLRDSVFVGDEKSKPGWVEEMLFFLALKDRRGEATCTLRGRIGAEN